MATANNAVKMVYVSGESLPATTDADAVYFVAGAKQLYVGSVLIADSVDLSDELDAKQDNITVTTSGSGNFVSNVEWDSTTATLTITKSTLPVLSKGTATGTGGILSGISVNDHEITEAFIDTLPSGTKAATPTADTEVANKKYVDDSVADLTGAMHFKGISTTEITDGGTESATIDGETLTPAAGDVVIYGNKEFVWSGSRWNELGDTADFALKTTQVIAGDGLTGGGALSSNVTITHDAVGTTSADDVAADVANTSINVMSGVDKDQFGHVASINEKNIYQQVSDIADAAADAVALKWQVV